MWDVRTEALLYKRILSVLCDTDLRYPFAAHGMPRSIKVKSGYTVSLEQRLPIEVRAIL